jgi:hypothetical protein
MKALMQESDFSAPLAVVGTFAAFLARRLHFGAAGVAGLNAPGFAAQSISIR